MDRVEHEAAVELLALAEEATIGTPLDDVAV